ncbi:AI-2E family transporter [Patescibacteria group bacterium]
MINSDKNINITLSSASFFKAIMVLLLFVLLYILKDLVLVLLTAVVVASAIEPATRWFGRYKIPRVPAVILIYLLIFTILIGIFYLFIPPLFQQASVLTETLPKYLESVNLLSPFGGEGAAKTEQFVGSFTQTFSMEEALTSFQNTIAGISGSAFETISIVFGGVFSFLLIIVISFYLAVQERGIEDFLQIITPVKHEKYIADLWHRSQAKIGKWMQGQLLLGLLIGVLVYLGLTILGVQYALLLALLAAFAELIPLFGPILAAVPAIIFGFMDSATLGLMVIGLYVIIQQFENHLIYPLVVRKVVGVPPLLVILALIVGGQLAGFLGILISVPVAAAIVEFTDDIQKEKRRLMEKEG